MSGFNIEKMFIEAKRAIEVFANKHKEETFYAFSIDASMLCLNSLEKFDITLKYYQQQYPESYKKPEDIEGLKYNTGDWEYQGFEDLGDGFDDELYSEHYHIPFVNNELSEDELKGMFSNTPYHIAMLELLERLMHSNIFDLLNKTSDFKAFLTEHEY